MIKPIQQHFCRINNIAEKTRFQRQRYPASLNKLETLKKGLRANYRTRYMSKNVLFLKDTAAIEPYFSTMATCPAITFI